LLQRLAQIGCALAQFVEQPSVLDGDDGLRGEALHQLDLLGGEGPHLLAVNADRADQVIVLQHRHDDDRTRTTEISEGGSCRITLEVRRLCLKVFDVHHLFRPDDLGMAASRMGTHRFAPSSLGKCRRYIVESDLAEYVSFVEIQRAEFGLAEPRRVLQHGLEHGLQVAGRA
jgi:hypothetical protein